MKKVVFFGSPEFAVPFLKAVHEHKDFTVCAIVCQKDKPAGRKQELTKPATKIYAENNKIMILQPETLRRSGIKERLKKQGADVFVVVAYGKIIPKVILDIPKLGTINVHPSLLPKYRGPSPIQYTILNQEKYGGVSIMIVDEKMDHGPLLVQEAIEISKNETQDSLRLKVTNIGVDLLTHSMNQYLNNEIKPIEQNHDQASFSKMLTREDALIDWNQSAEKIDAQIRAFDPWPGTHTIWKHDNREIKLKILKAKISDIDLHPGKIKIESNRLYIGTKTKALEILEIQPENSSKMKAGAFIQGYKKINGSILS